MKLTEEERVKVGAFALQIENLALRTAIVERDRKAYLDALAAKYGGTAEAPVSIDFETGEVAPRTAPRLVEKDPGEAAG